MSHPQARPASRDWRLISAVNGMTINGIYV